MSIVTPVFNEADNIAPFLRAIRGAMRGIPHEILLVYDFDQDSTLAAVQQMPDAPPSLRLVKNDRGPGVARALAVGLRAAAGDVVVTTMADGSDPPDVIPEMVEKIRRGKAQVVGGSRYSTGGSARGAPWLKQTLSRAAGLSLYYIGGLPTKDSTNNFRAYGRQFLDSVEIESFRGFEVALELTVKAHCLGFGVDEVPASWTERVHGKSRFQVLAFMPGYLRWYALGLGSRFGLGWGIGAKSLKR